MTLYRSFAQVVASMPVHACVDASMYGRAHISMTHPCMHVSCSFVRSPSTHVSMRGSSGGGCWARYDQADFHAADMVNVGGAGKKERQQRHTPRVIRHGFVVLDAAPARRRQAAGTRGRAPRRPQRKRTQRPLPPRRQASRAREKGLR